MQYIWKNFDELTSTELYAILGLRQSVFIVEQQSLYGDIDGVDLQAQHLLCYEGVDNQSKLAAYLRLLPGQERITIGRVVVRNDMRGQGLGTQLLTATLDMITTQYPQKPVYLTSQVTCQALYTRFGFEVISAPFDDAGVLHVEMCKQLKPLA